MMQATKAHTAQPVRKAHTKQPPQKGMDFVLAWLLLPVLLVCFVIYRWRVARADMGHRTVRYDD